MNQTNIEAPSDKDNEQSKYKRGEPNQLETRGVHEDLAQNETTTKKPDIRIIKI